MWSSNANDDEGGFNMTMTQSPAAGTATESKQNTVVPMAIRQLLNNKEENKNTHIVIVGVIKQVETQVMKNLFTIEDTTGRLLCIQWGEENDMSRYPKLIENAYFKVVGNKRIQNDKVSLLCHSVRPLESLNELTHHLLSIIALPYQMEEANMANITQQVPVAGANMGSSTNGLGFVDTTNSLSLNPKQLKVYTVIKRCQDEAGYSSADIQKILPENMALSEIEKILSFFIEEGHIFSTIDEYHYKVTDFGS